MPFHFCAEELALLMLGLSTVPFVGIYLKSAGAWLKTKAKPHCCDHDHDEKKAA